MSVKPLREVSAKAQEGEERLEQSLRPATFDEYVRPVFAEDPSA